MFETASENLSGWLEHLDKASSEEARLQAELRKVQARRDEARKAVIANLVSQGRLGNTEVTITQTCSACASLSYHSGYLRVAWKRGRDGAPDVIYAIPDKIDGKPVFNTFICHAVSHNLYSF